METRGWTLWASVLVLGCGATGAVGVRYVLEKPISEQCESAGLRGCPRITEGILLVAEGDKQGGVEKIREGAAQNESQDFQDFVAAMRLLGKVPGAGPYVGPINQVLAMVSAPSSQGRTAERRRRGRESDRPQRPSVEIDEDLEPTGPEPSSPRSRRVASTDAAPLPSSNDGRESKPVVMDPRLDVSKLDGETIVPFLHSESRPCTLGSPFTPLTESAKGRCVRERTGPIFITDVHATGGCTADVFAIAGTMSAPRWVIYVPSGTSLHITSAALTVLEREFFVIGTTASSENKLKGDVRCSLTWSGFRP